MSQENVDRFVEQAEAFNRLNQSFHPGDIDRWISFYDPEVRFDPQQAALQGRPYSGRKGIREWLTDAAEIYGRGVSIHLADIRDLGDRVLALGSLRFHARGSGIDTEAPVAVVATFQDLSLIHI